MFLRRKSQRLEREAPPTVRPALNGSLSDPPTALRKELTLGVVAETGVPFTLPRWPLPHWHVRGLTGSGKTSLTLIPLIDQLLDPYLAKGRVCRDAMLIIDLKGDQNLFHSALQAAKRTGRTFKCLIVDAVPGLDTCHFPPFQMLPAENQNLLAMAETLTQAFGMEHGPVYGGQYYSQQNLGALLRVARIVSGRLQGATFDDVSKFLDKHAREVRDSDQVRMTFSFLTELEQLRPHPRPERNIDVRQALREGHVIYVWTRTLRQAMTARLVAGLVLFSVIAIAQEGSTLGQPYERVIAIVDEFQDLVSASFSHVMAQCRAWMTLVLANQSSSQLKNRDLSMADFIAENTGVQQLFSCVGVEDVERLQACSKDKRIQLGGSTVHGLSTSVSFKDQIVPTLERDEALSVSATFGRSFFVVNDGQGHREPVVVQQTHEYPDLSNEPMPRRDPSHTAPREPAESAAKPLVRDAGFERRAQLLAELLAKKRAEEQWELKAG